MAGVRERWLSGEPCRSIWPSWSSSRAAPRGVVADQPGRGRNQLSYLYSVMWPAFGILGIYFWWMLIHTDFETVGLKGMRRQLDAEGDAVDPRAAAASPDPDGERLDTPRSTTADEDPELAAYNARVAASAAQGPKTWRTHESVVVRREQ